MNILITSAGQRVSLVRAFQKELKQKFPEGKVYTVDVQPELSAACNISDRYFKVKRVSNTDYIPELLELCLKNNVKMVIPTIDTELQVLAHYRELFIEKGIHLILSSLSFVDQCRDKRKISRFFEEMNIEIPRPVDKYNPKFPLFIKPYNGSMSVDTYMVESAEELTTHHLENEDFLFMEYIDKNEYDEFTVDMYYGKDSLVKCIVPRKRIFVRGGEVNKGLTCKNILVQFLKERLNYINGARGILTLQLFLHKCNSHIIGIEINPRFGGGYPLSYQAGANYPLWLIQEYFENKEIEYTEEWENNLLMLRYDDEVLIHDYKVRT
jgi:carbamoyl-phosphate synthase large subunit